MKLSFARAMLVALGVAVLAIALTDTPSAAWPGQGWSSSGGGGSGSTNAGAGASFVYQPGGTAGSNVYTSTSTLYAAMQAVTGVRTVYVDDSHTSPAVWAAGSYSLDGVIFSGISNYSSYSPGNLTGGATLQFAAGTTVTSGNLTVENSLIVESENTSAPVISVTSGGILNLYVLNNATINAQTAAPFASVTGTGWLHAFVSNFSGLGDGTHAALLGVSTTGVGGLEVEVGDLSDLSASAVQATGGGSALVLYDVTSAVNTGLSGVTVSLNPIRNVQASVFYVSGSQTVVSSSAAAAGVELQDNLVNVCNVATKAGDATAGQILFDKSLTDGATVGFARQTSDAVAPSLSVQAGGAFATAVTNVNGGSLDLDCGTNATGGSCSVGIGLSNAGAVNILYTPAVSSNWNPPPTRIYGALDTLAAHHFVSRLASSQSITSTSLTNVLGAITMAATDVWHARWTLPVTLSASGGYLSVAATVPTSAAMLLTACCQGGTSVSCVKTASATAVAPTCAATTAYETVDLSVSGDGTHAGTVQLQAAEATSGDSVTIIAGSDVWAMSE